MFAATLFFSLCFVILIKNPLKRCWALRKKWEVPAEFCVCKVFSARYSVSRDFASHNKRVRSAATQAPRRCSIFAEEEIVYNFQSSVGREREEQHLSENNSSTLTSRSWAIMPCSSMNTSRHLFADMMNFNCIAAASPALENCIAQFAHCSETLLLACTEKKREISKTFSNVQLWRRSASVGVECMSEVRWAEYQ